MKVLNRVRNLLTGFLLIVAFPIFGQYFHSYYYGYHPVHPYGGYPVHYGAPVVTYPYHHNVMIHPGYHTSSYWYGGMHPFNRYGYHPYAGGNYGYHPYGGRPCHYVGGTLVCW